MKVDGRLWLTHNDKNVAGRGRINLLARIAEHGSISQAAKSMGMSYKTAWDSVDAMNNAAGKLLVERSAGGRGGGGAVLTVEGRKLVEAFNSFEQQHRVFLDRLSADVDAIFSDGLKQ